MALGHHYAKVTIVDLPLSLTHENRCTFKSWIEQVIQKTLESEGAY